MNSSIVMNDMRKSMSFIEVAKPIIRNLIGGNIMTVEGSDCEVCQMLDTRCGTDYFQIYSADDVVYGVASRVQYGYPYNTFTVRKRRASGAMTEYDKRRMAIKSGGVYPFLTMQTYVDTNTREINSLAVMKTTDLFDFIEKGYADTNHTKHDKHGQASFYVAHWNKIKECGYQIFVYEKAA